MKYIKIIWLCRWVPLIKIHHHVKFGRQNPCWTKGTALFIRYVIVVSCDYCRWKLLLISYHSVKSSRYRSCRSGNIVFLIFYLTQREHVIEGTCIFMACGFLPKATILSSLVTTGLLKVEILFAMWSHVTTWSSGYVILWIIAFHQKPPSVNFGSQRSRKSKDIKFFISEFVVSSSSP